jgi:predicted DCC family thiol-disulfide oxidoreductase YuxK
MSPTAEPDPVLTDGPLVLFDGVCNLCNGGVRFLAPRDRTGRLRFAPIQSAVGQAVLGQHGLPLTDWDSFVFLEGGLIFEKSAAWFRLLHYLPQPWRLLGLFRLTPLPVADWFYDRVARNRYRLFGRHETCLLPTPELRSKFVG